MHVAILTFEGFNEIDSFVAMNILNRVKGAGWRVSLACPAPRVTSMNGVTIDAQCSGTLVLAKLGLLEGVPACTDHATKPWVVASGVAVLEQPFYARGNVATAGGCLAAQYLAAWIIARTPGAEAAEGALRYVRARRTST